jgi:hypothetical protein
MRKMGMVPPYDVPGDISKFSTDAGMWQCGLKEVLVAMKVAWNKKKTPVIYAMCTMK